jgi:hypothetical protein
MLKKIIPIGILGALALACGGGGGSSSTSSSAEISGTIFASYVQQAQVRFFDLGGNLVAGPTTSDNAGGYRLSLPNSALAADLILESSGGNFLDEATGLSTPAGNLSAYCGASTLAHQAIVSATPATTVVREIIRTHGNTLSEAKILFENAFGYSPSSSVLPTDATTPKAGATAASNLEGQRAAQWSQFTKDLGFSPQQQFELMEALAKDLGDGELDGKNGATVLSVSNTGLPRDLNAKYSEAIHNFRSSGNDRTGLLPENPVFKKTAYTSAGNYKIQWISDVMGTMDMGVTTGKSSVRLRVTHVESGLGVSGLNLVPDDNGQISGHF